MILLGLAVLMVVIARMGYDMLNAYEVHFEDEEF